MINKCVLKIEKFLLKYNFVKEETSEIYAFGFELLIKQLFHLSFMILVGAVMKRIVEVIAFIFAYSVFRRNAGGYHFQSEKLCFLSSGILVLVITFPLNIVGWNIIIKYTPLMFILGILLVLKLAPCDNTSKPMNQIERLIFKKKTKKVLVESSTVFIVSLLFQRVICYIIAISALLEGIGLLMGKLQKNEKLSSLKDASY